MMGCTLHSGSVPQPRFDITANHTNVNRLGADIRPGQDRDGLHLLHLGNLAVRTNLRQDGMAAVLHPMIRFPRPPQLASGDSDSGDGPLVRAARGGDRRACQAIWEKYASLVQRVVKRFLRAGPRSPGCLSGSLLARFQTPR